MANLGILQTGAGRASGDGIFGLGPKSRGAVKNRNMQSGRASAHRSGTLGAYRSYGVQGLGCSRCSGMGETGGGFSFTTDMMLGAALGAAGVYLYLTQGK